MPPPQLGISERNQRPLSFWNLQIINQLGQRFYVTEETNQLIPPEELSVPFPGRFYDTTADGKLTALDALRVINQLARLGTQEAAAGEQVLVPHSPSSSVREHERSWLLDELFASQDPDAAKLPIATFNEEAVEFIHEEVGSAVEAGPESGDIRALDQWLADFGSGRLS